MSDFSKKERALFQKLDTPAKIQDFLNKIPFNFEKKKVTLKSPLYTLRKNNAHCFEGALLGAHILSLHGFRPYVMYLKSLDRDLDHVIAPFKLKGYWGALSKTNHSVLRYREPVYRSVRELAMSFFHEYFLDSGEKTLRQYSALLRLDSFEENWPTSKDNLWGIDDALDNAKHYDMVPKHWVKKLRKADKVEIKAGKIAEWKK